MTRTQTSILIDDIVAHYLAVGIRGIFFDMDLTLTQTHTWEEMGIQREGISTYVDSALLRSITISPQFMRELLLAFNRSNIITGICSSQYTDLLHKFVYAAYGEAVYRHMKNFIIGRKKGSDKSQSLLAHVRLHPDIFRHSGQICLVDDDLFNCISCGPIFWTVKVPERNMKPEIHLHQLQPPRAFLSFTPS